MKPLQEIQGSHGLRSAVEGCIRPNGTHASRLQRGKNRGLESCCIAMRQTAEGPHAFDKQDALSLCCGPCVSKARSLGVTRAGEAALPNFLPFTRYGTFNNLCIAFHLATVCPTEKHGNRFWVSIVILVMYNRMQADRQASMRLIATESRDERTRELGTPYFLIPPLVVSSDFL